jgi:hypothetical protein
LPKKYVCYDNQHEDLTAQVLTAACNRGPWVPRVDVAWLQPEAAIAVDPIGSREAASWTPRAVSGPITVAARCSKDHQNVFDVDPAECEGRGSDRG